MQLPKVIQYSAIALAITGLTACVGDDGKVGKNGKDTVASTIALEFLGRYESGIFGASAAEIVTYDSSTKQAYVVNAESGQVDVLDINAPTSPVKIKTLQVATDVAAAIPGVASADELGAANSVSVKNGVLAVAIEADDKQANGYVAFYQTTDSAFLSAVEVGALPDMLTFTPDGSKVVVANEGEPNDDYDNDPEGSVSIIDVSGGAAALTATNVTQVRFTDFNTGGSRADELPAEVRIFGPGASVAQDLEPEYISISADSSTAWVSLQENNAIAQISLADGSISKIWPLGFKNYGLLGNELDASDKDDGINIRTWPVFGMYQPDSIASMEFNGITYLITANEGDSRDYDGYSEEIRIKDLADDFSSTIELENIDSVVFNGNLDDDENLGRLRITSTLGMADNSCLQPNGEPDGCEYNALYSYGARSFSIWNTDTETQVFDSGSDFERITAQRLGLNFNTSNDETKGDGRSDDKGPEPEALALGTINGVTYAFIGLERVGGIMVYNISNPENAQFVQYITTRDLSQPACANPEDGDVDGSCDPDDLGEEAEYNPSAGDLGPEGFSFVSAEDSPNGTPLLLVGNEVSGTTAIFGINIITLDEDK